uniref:G-protein coupled receptors family 1 profile domain-containing protein n=1 Tax=Plectus sambesii TaxID=2011161 RepID=A0A914X6E5_9BILA
MSSSDTATSCRDHPSNAYWNNATNQPDQSIANAPVLPGFLIYTVAGAISSIFNITCILTFITKKELREKYLLFAVLAFANLINTVFMFIAGTLRTHLIYNNQYMQLISTFECLQYPTPHLQLLGGQLPAVILIAIDIERLLAVYRPVFYKVHIGYRARIYIVLFCFVIVAISQLFGYLIQVMSCVSSMRKLELRDDNVLNFA